MVRPRVADTGIGDLITAPSSRSSTEFFVVVVPLNFL